jgi:NADH dehydrogenase
VADAVARSLDAPAALGRAFEIGGLQALSMNEILRTMLEVMGLRRPLLHAPAALARIAAAAMVAVLPDPPLTPGAIDFLLSAGGDVDPRPLRDTLGFQPTPLRDGLASYLAPAAPRPPGNLTAGVS